MFCDDLTERECLERNLFGDLARRLQELEEIKPGDIGFLLNINRDELIGIFRACSEAQLHIEPDAWDGKFAAQVRRTCRQTPEDKGCCVYFKEGGFGNETGCFRSARSAISSSRARSC